MLTSEQARPLRSLLDELFDETDDDEALVARDRAVLLNLDLVARLVGVRLVVRLVTGAGPDVLAVQGVAALRHDFDDDRFGHLVGDDLAGHLAAEAVRSFLLGRGSSRLRVRG